MAKLHRVCKVVHQVAVLYIETEAREEEDPDMSMIESDFDLYLSQLGFIAPQHYPGNGTAPGGESGLANVPPVHPTAHLGDWFSGNMHIMELMEEEPLELSLGPWPPTGPS
ncbi:putative Transcription factor domain-containing protein [Seiridium cardinale]|uniref:Transcription factor domain-containing protein n=1 Tax=Seiridium cardinale TaxID=138064 RepID=A0ABR2XLV3_9PEZI